MPDRDLDAWLDEIQREIGDEPGVDEYLEVMEKAERSSKRVEGLARRARMGRNKQILSSES